MLKIVFSKVIFKIFVGYVPRLPKQFMALALAAFALSLSKIWLWPCFMIIHCGGVGVGWGGQRRDTVYASAPWKAIKQIVRKIGYTKREIQQFDLFSLRLRLLVHPMVHI